MKNLPSLLLRAGLLTALVDGLFASWLNVAYGSTVTRLWQGVASTLLGSDAMNGGSATALIGLSMHVGVALGWTAVFLILANQWRWLRELLARPYGLVRIAAVYGPFIWLVMSLAVIPLLLQRPPAINTRWWINLAAHIPFVALPMLWPIAAAARQPALRDVPRPGYAG